LIARPLFSLDTVRRFDRRRMPSHGEIKCRGRAAPATFLGTEILASSLFLSRFLALLAVSLSPSLLSPAFCLAPDVLPPPHVAAASASPRSIHKYGRCSPSCFVLALVYVDRLISIDEFLVHDLNVHRIVICVLMVSAQGGRGGGHLVRVEHRVSAGAQMSDAQEKQLRSPRGCPAATTSAVPCELAKALVRDGGVKGAAVRWHEAPRAHPRPIPGPILS